MHSKDKRQKCKDLAKTILSLTKFQVTTLLSGAQSGIFEGGRN